MVKTGRANPGLFLAAQAWHHGSRAEENIGRSKSTLGGEEGGGDGVVQVTPK
jgi:hypothetical protein